MSYELFFIGLTITLIFIALSGYYPGGIIVPAYLILFVDQPLRLLATLVISLITWGIYKLLSHHVIIFGKRRFVFLILTGALFGFILSYILPQFVPETAELRVIGWVIPGLLANQIAKQGFVITISSLSIVLVILFGVSKLFYFLF